MFATEVMTDLEKLLPRSTLQKMHEVGGLEINLAMTSALVTQGSLKTYLEQQFHLVGAELTLAITAVTQVVAPLKPTAALFPVSPSKMVSDLSSSVAGSRRRVTSPRLERKPSLAAAADAHCENLGGGLWTELRLSDSDLSLSDSGLSFSDSADHPLSDSV